MTPAAHPPPLVGAGTRPGSSRARFVAALVLFAVSGAVGLVYEVAWSRRLLLLVGSTTRASAVVLAAFLLGLALGARLGGRIADRVRRPLVLYGVAEIAAAAWALFVPLLLRAFEGPFVSMAAGASEGVRLALRAGAAAAVVLPGAALVGASLPALLRAFVPPDRGIGLPVSLLYGVNTLGAVVGALYTGFFGVLAFGVDGVARVAAFVGAGVGAVAIALGRAGAHPPPARTVGHVPPVPVGALFTAFACGFVALGLETAGVRVLVFFVEGFTASFAAMLGVFLAGLAGGSLLLGPFLTRRRDPALAAGVLLALAGAFVGAYLLRLSDAASFVDAARRAAYAGAESAEALAAAHRRLALLGSGALFLVPALLLGATFPLAIRWARGGDIHGGRADVGLVSGRVAWWNGVGAALGPVGAWALLRAGASDTAPGGPLLALAAFAALAVLAGVVCLATVARRRPAALVFGVVALAAGAAFASPLLAAATPRGLAATGNLARRPPGGPPRTLRGVRSDEECVASVVETGPDRLLYTDDFQAAGTGPSYPYMRMLGHLPVLEAARAEHALVIAFGTGTSAGAVGAHPDVRRLEIAETSRAVLSLADAFTAANGGVLGREGTTVRVEDGRNVLLLHAPDLDVVTLEPLLPYVPAALPFYTREFYRLARARLREGGVLCQWVPVHAMPVDLWAALVRTFFEEFPDGSLWFFEQSTLLLGRVGTTTPAAAVVRARAESVRTLLEGAGFVPLEAFAYGRIASGREVLAHLDAAPPGPLSGRVVTDEDPFPETMPTPRGRHVAPYRYLYDTLEFLHGLATTAADAPDDPVLSLVAPADREAFRRATRTALRARVLEARVQLDRIDPPDDPLAVRRGLADAEALYGEALDALHLGDLALKRRRVGCRRERFYEEAIDEIATARLLGPLAEAAAHRAAATRAAEEACVAATVGEAPAEVQARTFSLFGLALAFDGRCEEAEGILATARARFPDDVGLRDTLVAVARRRRGERGRAEGGDPRDADLLADGVACVEDPLRNARDTVARLVDSLLEGNAQKIAAFGTHLLAVLGADPAARRAAAAVVEKGIFEGGPEAVAERAALLRALDPAHAALGAALRSTDERTWRAALRAAARHGFAALRVFPDVDDVFVRSTDPARRAAAADAFGLSGARAVLERAVGLLGDPDASVRSAAWGAVRLRIPPERLAELAYDPDADEPARREAVGRLVAWVATRAD